MPDDNRNSGVGQAYQAGQDDMRPEITWLEAETARLQERVEEAEGAFDTAWDFGLRAARERDRYKALAELRKEALEDCGTALHADRMHEGRFKDCERWGCSAARAAIDALPEEKEKEKERQR